MDLKTGNDVLVWHILYEKQKKKSFMLLRVLEISHNYEWKQKIAQWSRQCSFHIKPNRSSSSLFCKVGLNM